MYPLLTCGTGRGYARIPDTWGPRVTGRGVSLRGDRAHTEMAALTPRGSKAECAVGTVQAGSSSKSSPCRVKFTVLPFLSRLFCNAFPPLHSTRLAYQLEKENKNFLVPGPSARPTRSLSRTHAVREWGPSHQQRHVRPPPDEGVRPRSAAPAHTETLPRGSHSGGTPVHTAALCRVPVLRPYDASPPPNRDLAHTPLSSR